MLSPTEIAILIRVAASIASSMIQKGGSWALEAMSAHERQEALKNCVLVGLAALLEEGVAGEDREGREQVSEAVEHFFRYPEPNVLLMDLLQGKPIDTGKLVERFAKDASPETLQQFDPEKGFAAFLEAFERQAIGEPAFAGVIEVGHTVEQTRLKRREVETEVRQAEALKELPDELERADHLLEVYLRSQAEEYAALPLRPLDPCFPKAGMEVRREKVQYYTVEIFYATDRKRNGNKKPGKFYGAGRGDGLSYGTCEVTLPRDRRLGELPGPSLWRLEWHADPEKHVILRQVTPVDRESFFAALQARLIGSAQREVLVFVHGFNVTFEDAARRTAQIAYDLQFPGAPILYSWPSHGRGTLLAYTHDGSNADWSAPHLEHFLEELAAESGAARIHLIAHSMGNRVLVEALHRAALRRGAVLPRFHEVLLTAPDIDAEVFRELAAEMLPAAQRVTLYASRRDRALLLSQGLNGFPRAGDAGDDIVVVPPMESIDASEVDTDLVGHFYYGDNRSVLSDTFYLLRDGLPAGKRFGHETRQGRWGIYWALRP